MKHILIPDQIIFKERTLSNSTFVSYYTDHISVEEGWGTKLLENGNYGNTFAITHKVTLVCKPKLVNRKVKRFNRQ